MVDIPRHELDIEEGDEWQVIEAYFTSSTQVLVKQQLDSFDTFLMTNIAEIIHDTETLMVNCNTFSATERRVLTLKFGDVKMTHPLITEDGRDKTVTPNQCRLRNMTYASALYVQVLTEEKNPATGASERTQEDLVKLGTMPVMLRSEVCGLNRASVVELGECPYDSGGYFIVNGSEKVLIAQEKMAANRVSVFHMPATSKYSYMAEVRSCDVQAYRPPRTLTLRLLASATSKGALTVQHRMDMRSANCIHVRLPYINADVPMAIVFRAMGHLGDKDILQHICYDFNDRALLELLRPSLEEGRDVSTKLDARNFIGARGMMRENERAQWVRDLFEKQVLPHINDKRNKKTLKAYYIGYAINKLCNVALGRLPESDRDHYGNKRLDLAGSLLSGLFRKAFEKVVKDTKRRLDDCSSRGDLSGSKADRYINSNTITKQFLYSIGTGNWNVVGGKVNKTGVSQSLNRLNFMATLSHLRRLNTPTERTGKIPKPRQLHNTQWGMICPVETPEGQSCGLVKNLALMTWVSNGSVRDDTQYLEKYGVESFDRISPSETRNAAKVFLNGAWVGIHRRPAALVNHMRAKRRENRRKWTEMSVVFDERDKNNKEVRISTEPGRCCRPLFVVDEDTQRLRIRKSHIDRLIQMKTECDKSRAETDGGRGPPNKAWKSLMQDGVIELIDTEEEETTFIAMSHMDLRNARHRHRRHRRQRRGGGASGGGEDGEFEDGYEYDDGGGEYDGGGMEYEDDEDGERNGGAMAGQRVGGTRLGNEEIQYTHCEIHPSMILSVCGSVIPFPDHNQSPRNTYQCAMGKQAMGVYSCNYNGRFDSFSHILYYPQKPIVFTKPMQFLNFSCLPSGQNPVVAIMCYSGYNQEDSIIMNQSAIDRGLFRSFFYRTYVATLEPKNSEVFEKPGVTVRKKKANYECLDSDGFVPPGTKVRGEDIIIGKTTQVAVASSGLDGDVLRPQREKRDTSTPMRATDVGIVDQVMYTVNEQGYPLVKTKVRSTRVPQMGDKFSSRHGQKGTVGITYRQEDMPFTLDGIAPDIIINPHAIPSRMTVGQLMECLMGKTSAIRGSTVEGDGDGTPFCKITVDEICNKLHELRYQKYGNETLYSGFTGRQLAARVFIGPTYYQRLKHMVDDKIHSRARGPVTLITRQPVEGRARDGGLRFGEMERDCIVSHGAAAFLRERLFYVSDKYHVCVCDLCGLIAIADYASNTYECKGCANHTRFSLVPLPYACKLLFQEMMAMGITPRIMVSHV